MPSPAAPSLQDVHALVLGADGFIGRWTARALVRAGARVTACVRSARAARPVLERWSVEASLREVDLARPAELSALLADTRPAMVFNLAGYGVGRDERDPELAHALNADLVQRLASATARWADPHWTGSALVHAGSALEYGEVRGDLAEDGPHDPTTLYGRTKLAGTRALALACQATGLRGLTARLFMVYGPGERAGRLLPTLLEAARKGADVPLSAGRQRRDFTYVEEVAEGLLRLACARVEPGAVCNLATGRLVAVADFARSAAGVLGIAAERLRFGALPLRAEEMEHAPVTVDRLLDWTGWRPSLDPESGVRAAAAFLGRRGVPE